MNTKQRKRIVDRHRDSLKRFGHHPNALYWSSRNIQYLRFQVLSEIGIKSGDSVLDVGCGFADLNDWLRNQQALSVQYSGIDLSPDLIQVAQQAHPEIDLQTGELLESNFQTSSFDWVLLSGALNEPYADEGKYTKKIIAEMYRLAHQGVAFNLLNEQAVQAHDLQSFKPALILEYCQTLCLECQLRTDYLSNDFTIYMYKTPTTTALMA